MSERCGSTEHEAKKGHGLVARATEPPFKIALTTLPAQPCSYLPGLEATARAFCAERLPPEIYHDFMDAGFRRSGTVIYQPICRTCRLCVPIRVPVDQFIPNKSQRRSVRRNADILVTAGVPISTDEKFDLYQRYQKQWHDKEPDACGGPRQAFDAFLYESPVDTFEFCYRTPDGKLAAVGIADICSRSFSSVYFYFDPSLSQRSLGTFSTIYEIGWAKERNIPHYYMGYWIDGCETMTYKCNFRRYELLAADGSWHEPHC